MGKNVIDVILEEVAKRFKEEAAKSNEGRLAGDYTIADAFEGAYRRWAPTPKDRAALLPMIKRQGIQPPERLEVRAREMPTWVELEVIIVYYALTREWRRRYPELSELT